MKPIYELYLHDFGNMACQLIQTSENKNDLEAIAENINQLLDLNGHKNLHAEVEISDIEAGAE